MLYIITFIIFIAIDYVWLNIIARNYYQDHLSELLADNFKLLPAALFYILYPAGICYLVIKPGISNESLVTTLLGGAVLGFIAYSTYNLTNAATLKHWPLKVALTDIPWGTFVTSVSALLAHLIFNIFNKS